MDADSAIDLNASYGKGYSTKGSALLKVGRVTEAIAAFQAGLQVDPDNANLKSNLALAQSSAGSAPSASGAPPSSLGQYLAGSRAAMVSTGKASATIVALVLSLAHLFIPNPLSAWCYYTVLAIAGALHVVHVLEAAGTPSFTAAYGAQVMNQESTFLAFTCLTFSQAPPTIVALVPLLLYSVIHMCYWVHALLTLVAPAAAVSAAASIDSVMPSVTGQERWAEMDSRARYGMLSGMAQGTVAQLQVMLGIFLIVNLLTPSRSLIALFLHWRNLQMQVQLGTFPHINQAFASIDTQLLSLTHHQYCPGIVRSGYASLRTALAGMAARPQPGAGGGGLAGALSSCSIQ